MFLPPLALVPLRNKALQRRGFYRRAVFSELSTRFPEEAKMLELRVEAKGLFPSEEKL